MNAVYKPQGKELEEIVDRMLRKGYILDEKIQDLSKIIEVICTYGMIEKLEKLDNVQILVNKDSEENGVIKPYRPNDEEIVYATIKIENVGPSTELSHSFIPTKPELYLSRRE
jgi:hypothetical protein